MLEIGNGYCSWSAAYSSLTLRAELGIRGYFKCFHPQYFLFHLLYQTRVGMIPYNTGELRMVITDETRIVDDHIIDRPLAQLVRQPKIYEGVDLWAHQLRSYFGKSLLPPLRQIPHLRVGDIVNCAGKHVSE